jgi:hypothetical protein
MPKVGGGTKPAAAPPVPEGMAPLHDDPWVTGGTEPHPAVPDNWPSTPAEEPTPLDGETRDPANEIHPSEPVDTNVEKAEQDAMLRATARKPAKGPVGMELLDGIGYTATTENEKIKVLLYGLEGTRKTTGAALASELGPVFYINAEGGYKPTALAKHGVNLDNVRVWPNPEKQERLTFEGLEKLHRQLAALLNEHPGAVHTIVIDTVAEIFGLFREDASDNRVGKQIRGAGENKLALEAVDKTFIDRGDYGVATDQIGRLLRRFRDLPCHLVLIAHERYDEDAKMTGPGLSPVAAADVMKLVDMAFCCKLGPVPGGTDDDPEFARALTRKGANTRAKDRFDATPRVLVDPTFPRILAYKEGTITENTDPAQIAFRDAQAATAATAKPAAPAAKPARPSRAVSKTTTPATPAKETSNA